LIRPSTLKTARRFGKHANSIWHPLSLPFRQLEEFQRWGFRDEQPACGCAIMAVAIAVSTWGIGHRFCHAISLLPSLDKVQLFQPANERMGCRVSLFSGGSALNRVQYLVALVDAGPCFLLSSKTHGVFKIADNPSVSEMQLRRKMKFW
jgi:hypothetical protein